MRTLKAFVPILVLLLINSLSAFERITDDAVIVEGAKKKERFKCLHVLMDSLIVMRFSSSLNNNFRNFFLRSRTWQRNNWRKCDKVCARKRTLEERSVKNRAEIENSKELINKLAHFQSHIQIVLVSLKVEVFFWCAPRYLISTLKSFADSEFNRGSLYSVLFVFIFFRFHQKLLLRDILVFWEIPKDFFHVISKENSRKVAIETLSLFARGAMAFTPHYQPARLVLKYRTTLRQSSQESTF